ncbi:MAG: hypothetical protein C0618_08500 [Desulfuromonas sp.]|nr:MAG: hypothetical protein C0618_08500 [Desulfuromonas sp.]
MELASIFLLATTLVLTGALFVVRRNFRMATAGFKPSALAVLVLLCAVLSFVVALWLGLGESVPGAAFSAGLTLALAVTLLFSLESSLGAHKENVTDQSVDGRLEDISVDLFENAIDPIFIVDTDFRYRQVNRRAIETFGFSREEFLSMTIFDVIPQEQVPTSKDALEKLKTRGCYEHFIGKMRHKDGSWRDIEVGSSALYRNGEIIGSCDIVRDISLRKAAERQLVDLNRRLEQQALHDPLTGLPNRRMLYQHMERCLARCRRNGGMFAVLYVDLNYFKQINDQFGHKEGDFVLKACAERLMEKSRGTDIVSRIGGDEFVVLIEDVDTAETVKVIETNLCQLFSRPIKVNNRLHTLQLSVGVSLFPHDAETADDLISSADRRMYIAKKRGRARSDIVCGS